MAAKVKSCDLRQSAATLFLHNFPMVNLSAGDLGVEIDQENCRLGGIGYVSLEWIHEFGKM